MIGTNNHVIASRMKRQTTNTDHILCVIRSWSKWNFDEMMSLTVNTLCAFFTDALEMSNNFTVQSRDADAKICSFGWNSKYATSSVWSYSVRMTGCPCWSPTRDGSMSSGADLANIRSTSKIWSHASWRSFKKNYFFVLLLTLMLASTLPVATNWPSWLNAPERQACLCDVT